MSLPTREAGATLIESLVAILIFSFGLLGLIGLQAASIKNTAEAKYRADAAYLANQIIGEMWSDNPANLASYAHNPTAGGTPCTPAAAASGNAKVTTWLGNINSSLPGAASTMQQIVVNAGTGQVTVTVCWLPAQEATPSNFVTVAQVAGS
jgi:type IV pilus assembly protein PilV